MIDGEIQYKLIGLFNNDSGLKFLDYEVNYWKTLLIPGAHRVIDHWRIQRKSMGGVDHRPMNFCFFSPQKAETFLSSNNFFHLVNNISQSLPPFICFV